MAGYDWREGKSRNAVSAEEVGMRTGSQLARMIRKGVSAEEIGRVLQNAAWHHTSGHFNRTDYYWEPLIELLARNPEASEEEARAYLLSAAQDLRASTDPRDLDLAENAEEIASGDSFHEHFEEKRSDLQELIVLAAERKRKTKEGKSVKANISYPIFTHSRRSGYKVVGRIELKGIDAEVKGDWIIFDNEGTRTRKKLSSACVEVEYL
jgi:hypothetical protein